MQGDRDGHHGGQAAACVGGPGAPVPDLSGSQEGLGCPRLGVLPQDLGRVWCQAKFASPSEETLEQRKDGMSCGW
jgi:hypothetical protein